MAEVYLQCEADNIAGRAVIDLIEQIFSEPCYDTLRTKEQLGYSVHCGLRLTHGVLGFCITVVSGQRLRGSNLNTGFSEEFQVRREGVWNCGLMLGLGFQYTVLSLGWMGGEGRLRGLGFRKGLGVLRDARDNTSNLMLYSSYVLASGCATQTAFILPLARAMEIAHPKTCIFGGCRRADCLLPGFAD